MLAVTGRDISLVGTNVSLKKRVGRLSGSYTWNGSQKKGAETGVS